MPSLRFCARNRPLSWSLLVGALLLAGWLPCFGQQIHRNTFEAIRTSWIKGDADVAYEEIAHELSDQVAHEGKRSEHIKLTAKQGSHIYYYYPTGNAPISDELTASLWVKSSNPGIQLMARVVLPKEANPSSLEDRLTTIIRGDVYRRVGGWQRLEIGRPVKLAKEQQQFMQAQLKRPINFQDAYIDRLMVNVYGGPGTTDVWLDELEVGPVLERPAPKPAAEPPGKIGPPMTAPSATANKFVTFNGSNLQVDGKRFFFMGIRHTDTPPKDLRDAGFNTLFVDHPWDPAQMRQMADLGFWLVPGLPVTAGDARFVSRDSISREVRGFPEQDSILFWYLGTALEHEQSAQVTDSANGVLSAHRQRALGADVWDGLGRYSTNINLVSFHRWPLMTTLELSQYKEWLDSRARLANPGTFLWTWIQTHIPDDTVEKLYGRPAAGGFTEPIGPQPEHVRLLTYLAVGSGFRGLGFWSDRFLANSYQGRDRLLTLALLNQEMEFLQPLLTNVEEPPTWIDTDNPNVKAAVMRTTKGILVLPMWLGSGSQFVPGPGQAAVHKLTITVPQVPPTHSCWEITPGEVRHLKADRGTSGGMRFTLPEFGLTTAVLFTPDYALIGQFQELRAAREKMAAELTYELAVEELAKIAKVEEELERTGYVLPDSAQLMADAYRRLRGAKSAYDNHQYGASYRESQRALRPARILMREQWEKAVRELETPVASPWAVSFYTLPRHWEFMSLVRSASPGANILSDGSFELGSDQMQVLWEESGRGNSLDDVDMRAERVSQLLLTALDPKTKKIEQKGELSPKEGHQFLVLEIKPKAKGRLAPKALERSYLAMTSRKLNLPPGALVRVSGWMAVPEAIKASPDGALIFDSAGGEPLGYRTAATTGGWKHFTLYRRVPPTGELSITLALTGLGRVAFDDIRIEPMVAR